MSSCPHRPEELKCQPIGMYHCPACGMMVVAGVPHPPAEDDFDYEGPEPREDQLPSGPLE